MAIIEFLLFCVSSGLFFNERFRKNPLAIATAGLIATIAFLFLSIQIQDLISGRASWDSLFHIGSAPAKETSLRVVAPQDRTPGTTQQTFAPSPSAKTIELEYWKSVSREDTVTGYQAYLERYPDGVFANIARERIAQRNMTARNAPAPGASQAPPTTQTTPSDQKCVVLFTGEKVCSDKTGN